MPDDMRVQQLLDELCETESTPEEVCSNCPEFLQQVRQRWRQIQRARVELEAMFPPFSSDLPPSQSDTGTLPQISGYEVESIIGRGGMGVIFRARHMRLNRIVALKMALAGGYASENERKRFQREVEAVAGLQHPNIVQIFDVGDCRGQSYFTMEFVEGGSLAGRLGSDTYTPRQAALLLSKMTDAIETAHRAGIVHRDLKPSNVLLATDGTPKITDFGLARRMNGDSGLTFTGTVLGTPSYMAPEQAGSKRATMESAIDIYALGAILYELLTRRPPFRAKTAEETVQQMLTQDPVHPSVLNARVPRDLETICLKCLHKEPQLRYASATALKEDLDRFVRGEAIAARPESLLQRYVRRIRRRPVFSLSLVVGASALAVLVGMGVWLHTERASLARRSESDQAAAERAADDNLTEMVRLMRSSSWTESKAALERARVWLGNRESADLHRRLDQGSRDLKLVEQLDTIRLTGYARSGEVLSFSRADYEYEEAFREAGLGEMGENPEIVSLRIKQSPIQNALLAALDFWSVCSTDPKRTRWVIDVATQGDGDLMDWRRRVRDPAIWKDETALIRVIDSAPLPEQAVSLLLAVEIRATAPAPLHIKFLKHLYDIYPRDFWLNLRLGQALTYARNYPEAIGYYQAALALRSGVAVLHHNLGVVLAGCNRFEEAAAQLRQALLIDPDIAVSREYYAQFLFKLGQHEEAIVQARTALRLDPKLPVMHALLGKEYESLNRPDEAVVELRQAFALDPKNVNLWKEVRDILLRQRRLTELCAVWGKALEEGPPEHDRWYGYAELCLFLGQEEDYFRARRLLLDRFGGDTDPFVAERTSRACLLRPASGEELIRIVRLSERARESEQSGVMGGSPFFQFAKGLADYRSGKFERTITAMRGDAARVLGPAPRLVLAMALYRSGQIKEARKELAGAICTHDWRIDQAKNQDDWIFHSLRREAEAMILPHLEALLDGTQKPLDNDERLASLGVLHSRNRFLAAANVYAEVFATDPNLVRDLQVGHLFNAARMAALCGCGHGEDGQSLGETERKHWRTQALQWLQADLAACRGAFESDPTTRERVRWKLQLFRDTPDLAGVRDSAELKKLPADEQKRCISLWNEVDVALRNTEDRK